MTPRLIEPVEIELDRKRFLDLDMAALWAAEKELSKQRGQRVSVFRVIQEEVAGGSTLEALPNLSVELILVLFWAALLRNDPEITLDQAGRLARNIGLVMRKTVEIVNRVFTAALDVDEQEEEPQAEKKTNSAQRTGSNSAQARGSALS